MRRTNVKGVYTGMILKLLKFEFKANKKTGNIVLNILSTVFSVLVLLALSGTISIFLVNIFQFWGSKFQFISELSLMVLIIFSILFFYSLTTQLKNVFFFRKKELLAFLPVEKREIYLAKILYSFIKVEILSILITVPASIIFGMFFEFGVKFYLIAAIISLFIAILPFALANLILIPVMHIMNFFKNKNLLRLAVMVIIFILAIYFYMQLVFELASVMLLQSNISINLFDSLIEICGNIYMPSLWVAKLMLGISAGKHLAMYSAISLGILAIGISIGCLTYKHIFTSNLVEKVVAKNIKTSSKTQSVFTAYFKLEVKELFRKSNLLFTYVEMGIAMPFIAIYCNKFIMEFATTKIGSGISVGTTLFVVLIFMSIICSPVASFISKEGENFWILKTNPNGIGIPLLAKTIVGFCFSCTSLTVTILLSCLMKQIAWKFGMLIFAIALIYIIALVSIGMLLNLIMPNIFKGYQEKTSNVAILLFLGLACSVSLGVFAIIKSFSMNASTILLICLASVSVLAVVSVAVLLISYKHIYARMEV